MTTLPAAKGDIRHGIKLLGGVDHPTAAQDQIERHCNLLILKEAAERVSPIHATTCVDGRRFIRKNRG